MPLGIKQNVVLNFYPILLGLLLVLSLIHWPYRYLLYYPSLSTYTYSLQTITMDKLPVEILEVVIQHVSAPFYSPFERTWF